MARTREQIEDDIANGIARMKPLVEEMSRELNSMSEEEKHNIQKMTLERGNQACSEFIDDLKRQAKSGRLLINSFDSKDMTLSEFLKDEGIIE